MENRQNGQEIKFPTVTVQITDKGLQIQVWHTGYYYQTLVIPPEQSTQVAKSWLEYQIRTKQQILTPGVINNV